MTEAFRVVRGYMHNLVPITPDTGYVIEDVLVDGDSVGAVDKYTFENVREKHTIEAVFAEQYGGVAVPGRYRRIWLAEHQGPQCLSRRL
jgi:hypothetical protein